MQTTTIITSDKSSNRGPGTITSPTASMHPIHFDPNNYVNRYFENEDYVGEEEIAALIYGSITKLKASDFPHGFEVDDFIYDHISNFDQFYDDGEGGYMGWYMDEDTDEKDGLRDRIYEEIGLTYKDEDGYEDSATDATWDELINLEYWKKFEGRK